MKKILFDIGANNGNQWLNELAIDQENTFVFMFEPTPYLCGVILEKYKHLKNWILVEKAVSNYKGISQFNIAGHADWGCSSLMSFRQEREQTWPSDRTDLNFTDTLDVEVTTLAEFLNDNPWVTHIDYLHIDAQGSDLNVLKGLGDFIDIVKQGQIEAAFNAPLYTDSPTHTECIEWLEAKGFTAEVRNANHECDIYFSNTRFYK
jgi:FkbM family methyltransferase